MPAAALIPGIASAVGGIFSSKPKAQAAPVISPVSQQQADQSFGNTQNALAQQQAFMQALQQQGGVQNQSDVYNMLAMQAQGQGPNPAAAALQQATGQNIAAQNALMAGQRGAAANPALMARQAAMQGANIQQQAVGQGALMQAQQQQAAINNMGNIAGQQVGNLANAQQMYGNTALNQQQNLLNSIAGVNSVNSANAANMNSANRANADANNRILGGVVNAAGTIPSLFPTKPAAPKYDFSNADGFGGGITQKAHGGEIKSEDGPKSSLGQALRMMDGGTVPGKAKVEGDSLKNDTVHALLSPGEIVIPRTIAEGEDAPRKAMEFVAAIKARKRK